MGRGGWVWGGVGGGGWLSIPAAWLASKEKQETKTFGPNSCLLDKVGGWLRAEAFAVMICPCLERLLPVSETNSQLCKLTFPNSLVHTCEQEWGDGGGHDKQTTVMLLLRCSVLLSFQTQLTSLADVHYYYHHQRFEHTCIFFNLTIFSNGDTHLRLKICELILQKK